MNSAQEPARCGLLTKTLAFAVLTLMSCGTFGADQDTAAIIGAWKLYKDDDRPNGPVPDELISFWSNGKFLIAGDSPHQGLYRINGDQLQFLAKVGDRAIPVARELEISGEQLNLKNRKVGWAYYKRVSKQPHGEEPCL